jgi:hypothetical protein
MSAQGRVTTYATVWDQNRLGGQGGWVQTTRLPYNAADNDHGQSVLIDVSTVFEGFLTTTKLYKAGQTNPYNQTIRTNDLAGRVLEYVEWDLIAGRVTPDELGQSHLQD